MIWTKKKRVGKLVVRALFPLCLLLLVTVPLSGCGNTCPDQPTGPATRVDGPITIVTDHFVYAPGQTVKITVTNHTSAAIETPPWYLSCLVEVFERQTSNGWQGIGVCPYGGGDTQGGSHLQPILPGASETGAIPLPSNLSSGTYRAQFMYKNVLVQPPAKGTLPPAYTSIYSATFRICA